MENSRQYTAGQYLRMAKTISEYLDKRTNAILKAYNLTNSQVLLLDALSKNDDMTCSLKALEAEMNMAQPTVVGLVQRLESKGLVTTCNSPKDHRVKYAQMTAEGKASYEVAIHAVANEIGPMLHMIMTEDELKDHMRKMSCIYRWIREQDS